MPHTARNAATVRAALAASIHRERTNPMRCYYAVSKVPPTALELDTLDTFDDRTLSSLIASNAKSQAMAIALGDGVDNDNPYNALPLERWRDRA
jgi:hypothetical protein